MGSIHLSYAIGRRIMLAWNLEESSFEKRVGSTPIVLRMVADALEQFK